MAEIPRSIPEECREMHKMLHQAISAGFVVLLATNPAWAEVQTRTVSYQHQGVELEGYLAWDDRFASEPRPGVLVVHEWWGLNDYARQRTRQLARSRATWLSPWTCTAAARSPPTLTRPAPGWRRCRRTSGNGWRAPRRAWRFSGNRNRSMATGWPRSVTVSAARR